MHPHQIRSTASYFTHGMYQRGGGADDPPRPFRQLAKSPQPCHISRHSRRRPRVGRFASHPGKFGVSEVMATRVRIGYVPFHALMPPPRKPPGRWRKCDLVQ